MFYQSCITCLFCEVCVREYICGKEGIFNFCFVFASESDWPSPNVLKIATKMQFQGICTTELIEYRSINPEWRKIWYYFQVLLV